MRHKVVKNLKYGFWRIDKNKIANNKKWWMAFFISFNAIEIQRKIKTFAHTESDKNKFTSLRNIKNCIKNFKGYLIAIQNLKK